MLSKVILKILNIKIGVQHPEERSAYANPFLEFDRVFFRPTFTRETSICEVSPFHFSFSNFFSLLPFYLNSVIQDPSQIEMTSFISTEVSEAEDHEDEIKSVESIQKKLDSESNNEKDGDEIGVLLKEQIKEEVHFTLPSTIGKKKKKGSSLAVHSSEHSLPVYHEVEGSVFFEISTPDN